MADKKISALTASTLPLAGTEVLPIVQNNMTVKVATDNLTVKNVRSNATTGITQIAGPAAGATRIMNIPDENISVARIDAAQIFVGLQTFTDGIKTAAGSATALNATMATVYTFPTVSEVRLYVVLGHTGSVGSSNDYGKFAFVVTDGGTATMYLKTGGGASDIQVSGMNFQVAQASGATRTVFGTVTRIA